MRNDWTCRDIARVLGAALLMWCAALYLLVAMNTPGERPAFTLDPDSSTVTYTVWRKDGPHYVTRKAAPIGRIDR